MNKWSIGRVRFGLENEKLPIELKAVKTETTEFDQPGWETECYELTELPGCRVLPERKPGETKPGDVSGRVILSGKDGVTVIRVQASILQNTMRECVTFEAAVPVEIELLSDVSVNSYSCQYQFNDWWTRPAFGNKLSDLPARTESVFLEYGKEQQVQKYGCLIPMLGEKTKAYLMGAEEGADPKSMRLMLTAYASGMSSLDEIALIYTEGTELFETIASAWKQAGEMHQVPMRTERQFPEMFDSFGWCSWDAFYTDVNEEKIREKAKEFQEKGLPVRWFLIDDGWLSVKDSMLYSHEPEKAKFPEGFARLTKDLKENTTIRQVGVWHAFGGYWGGVLKDSEAEQFWKEYLHYNRNGKLVPAPDAVKGYGFWQKWYEYLKGQGIDFVKVDGQSAVKNYFRNEVFVAEAAKQAHRALEAAVNQYMNGNLINCMGMAIENVLGRPASGLSRNSDDFLPEKEMGFAEHLMQNAYNALYHTQFYYGDWDMFWSKQEESSKHALLRAISGGPVYVSDRIGDTDPESIWPLIYSDGRILRMDRNALPTLHSVFHSPLEGNNLVLTNVCGKNGAMAVFHLGYQEGEQSSEICAADIPELKASQYIYYNRRTKELRLVERQEKISITLKKNDYSCVLFTALPELTEEILPLGLMDKDMSFHAIHEISLSGDKSCLRITAADGGIFGFAVKAGYQPKKIWVNGQETEAVTNAEVKTTGDLTYYQICLNQAGKQTLEILL